MLTLLCTFSVLLAPFTEAVALVQDPPAPAQAPSAQESSAAMRDRIRNLRRDLIAGGPTVRRAEAEAASFYREKMADLDEQADQLAVQLAEKRAGYDVALERTLGATSSNGRSAAAAEAFRLRGEIDALQGEMDDLAARRAELGRAVDLVQARSRERERLATEFEAGAALATDPYITAGGLGLAPVLPAADLADPLADDSLLQDLMARDPARARALILEVDPERYWRTWPLRPPAAELRKAIRFPLGDAPDRR